MTTYHEGLMFMKWKEEEALRMWAKVYVWKLEKDLFSGFYYLNHVVFLPTFFFSTL